MRAFECRPRAPQLSRRLNRDNCSGKHLKRFVSAIKAEQREARRAPLICCVHFAPRMCTSANRLRAERRTTQLGSPNRFRRDRQSKSANSISARALRNANASAFNRLPRRMLEREAVDIKHLRWSGSGWAPISFYAAERRIASHISARNNFYFAESLISELWKLHSLYSPADCRFSVCRGSKRANIGIEGAHLLPALANVYHCYLFGPLQPHILVALLCCK